MFESSVYGWFHFVALHLPVLQFLCNEHTLRKTAK